MIRDLSEAIAAAGEIRAQMFPSANVVLLAGSVVRGEATPTSDLDLVVVFDRVAQARRQSFTFSGWPVEAFLHDPCTLSYFFREVDRPSGVPSLPNMVSEGIEIAGRTEPGERIKAMANEVLEAGPIPWGRLDRDNSRYAITDMVQDIRGAHSPEERLPVLASLYPAIANHYCRSRSLWAAKGKSIPRRLRRLDPEFCERFTQAFAAAFSDGDIAGVIHVSEEVLTPDGGFLFDGYTREAPKAWRAPDDP
ncbi:nucleotidyltransferase-like protein [Aliiruegeria haliotis]|uniref:Nucleotidyltransferase-like protein n=1 Tax=Aliiruegeria haliotis TaxID=1280846 RepID=A0A2T0RN67_9RHOB|nr:nucleotidyltransferase domain-containing protein [Aliiruegeria haliotis]PRY22635.1 nucleotidyltransferase-like protein [Aliiruegeria haliotis]